MLLFLNYLIRCLSLAKPAVWVEKRQEADAQQWGEWERGTPAPLVEALGETFTGYLRRLHLGRYFKDGKALKEDTDIRGPGTQGIGLGGAPHAPLRQRRPPAERCRPDPGGRARGLWRPRTGWGGPDTLRAQSPGPSGARRTGALPRSGLPHSGPRRGAARAGTPDPGDGRGRPRRSELPSQACRRRRPQPGQPPPARPPAAAAGHIPGGGPATRSVPPAPPPSAAAHSPTSVPGEPAPRRGATARTRAAAAPRSCPPAAQRAAGSPASAASSRRRARSARPRAPAGFRPPPGAARHGPAAAASSSSSPSSPGRRCSPAAARLRRLSCRCTHKLSFSFFFFSLFLIFLPRRLPRRGLPRPPASPPG